MHNSLEQTVDFRPKNALGVKCRESLAVVKSVERLRL